MVDVVWGELGGASRARRAQGGLAALQLALAVG